MIDEAELVGAVETSENTRQRHIALRQALASVFAIPRSSDGQRIALTVGCQTVGRDGTVAFGVVLAPAGLGRSVEMQPLEAHVRADKPVRTGGYRKRPGFGHHDRTIGQRMEETVGAIGRDAVPHRPNRRVDRGDPDIRAGIVVKERQPRADHLDGLPDGIAPIEFVIVDPYLDTAPLVLDDDPVRKFAHQIIGRHTPADRAAALDISALSLQFRDGNHLRRCSLGQCRRRTAPRRHHGHRPEAQSPHTAEKEIP